MSSKKFKVALPLDNDSLILFVKEVASYEDLAVRLVETLYYKDQDVFYQDWSWCLPEGEAGNDEDFIGFLALFNDLLATARYAIDKVVVWNLKSDGSVPFGKIQYCFYEPFSPDKVLFFFWDITGLEPGVSYEHKFKLFLANRVYFHELFPAGREEKRQLDKFLAVRAEQISKN